MTNQAKRAKAILAYDFFVKLCVFSQEEGEKVFDYSFDQLTYLFSAKKVYNYYAKIPLWWTQNPENLAKHFFKLEGEGEQFDYASYIIDQYKNAFSTFVTMLDIVRRRTDDVEELTTLGYQVFELLI